MTTRILAVLLLTAAAWLATTTSALAHAELIASNPAEGSTLTTPPGQLQLTFGEAVRAPFTAVTVTGPDGTPWGVGQPEVVNTVVTVPVRPQGPAGSYTITYRVLSDDGHPVSGTIRFTLTSPAGPGGTSQPPAQSAVATTAPTGGGVPAWVWIVGVVVLLAAGVVVARRVGRSSSS